MQKTDKYSGLAKDLEYSGFQVKLMLANVGARGSDGKSIYTFLFKIDLSCRERTKTDKNVGGRGDAIALDLGDERRC